MSFDLFISHSTADAETARVLVTDFENRGVTCWVAPRDIPMGSSYQNEIVSAIERCRAMLLLFSSAANNSEHVLREVELAAQNKKPIYPLRIDTSEPAGGLRYMLANKQWVERKALGNRLVETVEQLLAPTRTAGAGETSTKVREPVSPPPSSRLPLMAGAGALAAFAIAAALWLFSQPTRPPDDVALKKGPSVVTGDSKPGATAGQSGTAEKGQSSGPPPAADTPANPPPGQKEARRPDEAPPQVPPLQAPPPQVSPPQVPPPATPPPIVEIPPRPIEPKIAIASVAPADPRALAGTVHLFRECDMCPVMSVVPAGRSLIGSPGYEKGREAAEGPQQNVTIGQPFAVGRSEISFEQWLSCVAEGSCNAYRPGDYDWGYGAQPVINVSWTDAKSYVDWLSKKTGAVYRLLSEAEWEYAARGCAKACDATPFWFGAEISSARANYDWRFSYERSAKALPPRRTVPVDTGEANPFGLLHVHGNVREWVEDCWNDSLAGLPKDGSARATGDCRSHVLRGGSWADEPKDLRTAKRTWAVADERRAQIGFRVARALVP